MEILTFTDNDMVGLNLYEIVLPAENGFVEWGFNTADECLTLYGVKQAYSGYFYDNEHDCIRVALSH